MEPTEENSSVAAQAEEQTITKDDVKTVEAAAIFGGAGDNPFGAPPKEGESDDVFSVEVGADTGFRVTAGKQPLKLIDLAKSTSKAGNPMWVWNFVVLLGKDAGKEIKVFTALTAAAMWKVRETLAAFRIPGSEGGAAAKFKRSDVIGKYIIGEIEDSTFDGRPASNVAKMYPVKDEDVPRIEAAAKAALSSGSASPF